MKTTLKKVLAMVLVVAMTAGISIGSTLAYVQGNTPNALNMFTVGDIEVDLYEEVAVYGEGGTVEKKTDGATYTEVMPGDYLKKEVTVENKDTEDVYVRVTVTMNNADLINAAIDDHYENAKDEAGNNLYDAAGVQKMYNIIFDGWGINYNPRPNKNGVSDARGVIDGTYGLPEYVLQVDFAKTIKGSTVIGANNWFIAGREKAGQYWVDGPGAYDGYYTKNMEDYEICYTYYMLLPAGEKTTLFDGLNVPASFTSEQLKMFDGLQINIEGAAIQAENMAIAPQYAGDPNAKAKTAFAILAGDYKVPDDYTSKPDGNTGVAYIAADKLWGENSSNAKQSHVIKIYSGDTYLGETSLNNIDSIIDGDVTVTWNIKLDAESNTDEYWTMSWAKKPSLSLMPNRIELWVDGVKADEGEVQLNAPDNLNPIVGIVVDSEGTILRYVVKGGDPAVQTGETYVPFVSSNAELDEALKAGKTTLVLGSGNYMFPDSAQRKTLTIIGIGDAVITAHDDGAGEGDCDYCFDGSSVTFNNVTITTSATYFPGFARMKGIYNNCTINGVWSLYDNSEFNNCTFNISGDVYNVWTWGADVATFTDCVFNNDGKAILLYGGANTKLTVNGCTFNDNGGLADLKAAIEIGNDYGKSYELIVNNATVNGYEINDKGINTGTTLWANKNSMGTDKLNVVVDGADVY